MKMNGLKNQMDAVWFVSHLERKPFTVMKIVFTQFKKCSYIMKIVDLYVYFVLYNCIGHPLISIKYNAITSPLI